MESPLSYVFRDVPWAWYCTLTFDNKHNVKDQRKKWGWFRDWCRKVEGLCDLKKGSLPYIVVAEVGEKHGRFHFHSLVWIPDSKNVNLAYKAAFKWDCGIADIRSYDPRLGGAEYIQKNWFVAANKYESKKLIVNLDSNGRISNPAWWLASKMRGGDVPLILEDEPQDEVCREFIQSDSLAHPYGKRLNGASVASLVDPDWIS